MYVQIFSDLHLEFYKSFNEFIEENKGKISFKKDKKAECLILAGDIGKINTEIFNDFLKYVNKEWHHTFYVLGNHEFYHSKKTHEKLLEEYYSLCKKYANITLIEPDKEYFYGSFRIIGCTLWSQAKDKDTNSINCFKKIKMLDESRRTKPINIEYYNNLHKEHKYYLMKLLTNETIVITHYPIISKEEASIFSKELKEMNIKDCVFINGHTHFNHDFEKDGNRFISNQLGYPKEISKFKVFNGLFYL